VDVDTGQELGKAGPFVEGADKGVLYHCCFLPTAPNEVITGDAMGQVVIWNYETGEPVTRLHKTRGTTHVLVVDRQNLFVGEGLNVFEYVRIGQEWRLSEEITNDAARRGGISAVDRGTGVTAFACSNHSIVLNPPIRSAADWPDVTHVAFDPLGRFVATTNRSGEISLWQMKSWKHIRTWPAQTGRRPQLLFSPDGATLVSLGNRDAVVWDPHSGAERIRIPMGPVPIQLAISPDGQFLAAPAYVRGGATPYAIRLWKIADGTVHQTVSHASAANRGQLAFAGSNDTLVMGGGKGMTAWDLASSKLVADLGTKTLHDVPLAVHPDGKRVAMQPWSGPIEVWDITTQKKLLSTSVHAGKAMVNSIAVHPGGRFAASAGEDGTACLWEFDTGAVVKSWQLGPPKGIVFQVAFSPDGRYLATVNGNGTAYILRLDGIVGSNK
jgi:WD40 repeat protein